MKVEDKYPDSSVIDIPNDEDRFTHNFIMREKREAFTEGYRRAIADAKEWIEKNASKDIYKNYDSTGFRSFWANGLARDLYKELTNN